MFIPEVGSLYQGGIVDRRKRRADGSVTLLIDGNWQPLEVAAAPATLTPEHIELLTAGGNGPERQAAVAAWAQTPQGEREAVVRQCRPEIVQRLKQTVLYG